MQAASGSALRLVDYANVPPSIGTVVSRGFATFHELDTVYGTQDLYDMLEVIAVDNHNQRVINSAKA